LTKSDTQEKTIVEAVAEEIKKFEAVQKKYREFGAYDTEPDGVFQKIVDDAVKGSAPAIPRDGENWQLYASSMDCSEAANALHDQALAVVRAIESCPIRDIARLRAKLKDYCWRLY